MLATEKGRCTASTSSCHAAEAQVAEERASTEYIYVHIDLKVLVVNHFLEAFPFQARRYRYDRAPPEQLEIASAWRITSNGNKFPTLWVKLGAGWNLGLKRASKEVCGKCAELPQPLGALSNSHGEDQHANLDRQIIGCRKPLPLWSQAAWTCVWDPLLTLYVLEALNSWGRVERQPFFFLT